MEESKVVENCVTDRAMSVALVDQCKLRRDRVRTRLKKMHLMHHLELGCHSFASLLHMGIPDIHHYNYYILLGKYE